MTVRTLVLLPLCAVVVVVILTFAHNPTVATFGEAKSQITPDGAVWLETAALDDNNQYDLMRWMDESQPVVYSAYACQHPFAVTSQQVLTRTQANPSNPHETWLGYSEGALMDGVGVTGMKSTVYKAELLPETR
jgi:hypothetical protein